MRLLFVTPHFAPDVAPTGEVVTRIVEELASNGHRIEVITSLPWYRQHRVEAGYDGRLHRVEDTPWGRVLRIHPWPTSDKQNLLRRALSFAAFSAHATAAGIRGPQLDAVIAVSPPLSLGITGWIVARARRGRFVFNIQDVFPDIAIELGALTDRRLIDAARRLERFIYERADDITVLSDDLLANVAAKVSRPSKVRVIPNFVDTGRVTPSSKENAYRREFGLEGKFVVMYAGNVGLSQPLELVVEAAGALAIEEDVAFVINGQGARRGELEHLGRGVRNLHFVDMQPAARLPEVLAAADVHVVALKRGLASSSVPSKTYSILAAARPLIASVDPDSEVARLVEEQRCGIAVPPEDLEAFVKAVRGLLEAPEEVRRMGEAGRAFVERWASPAAVARAYEELVRTE